MRPSNPVPADLRHIVDNHPDLAKVKTLQFSIDYLVGRFKDTKVPRIILLSCHTYFMHTCMIRYMYIWRLLLVCFAIRESCWYKEILYNYPSKNLPFLKDLPFCYPFCYPSAILLTSVCYPSAILLRSHPSAIPPLPFCHLFWVFTSVTFFPLPASTPFYVNFRLSVLQLSLREKNARMPQLRK